MWFSWFRDEKLQEWALLWAWLWQSELLSSSNSETNVGIKTDVFMYISTNTFSEAMA